MKAPLAAVGLPCGVPAVCLLINGHKASGWTKQEEQTGT